MDPDKTLKQLREALASVYTAHDDRESTEVAFKASNLFDALDEWLTKGGFLPSDWNRDERVY